MRPFSPLSPRPFTRNRQGFALIITIILMSMLVLIMVSFSALTRVEVQIAANSQQAERARQNAMTALNIALGQLQAAAGPDQRVTARAEILDDTPSTSALTGVNQPHWTGVWKTGPKTVLAGLDIDPNGNEPQRQTSFGSLTPSLAQKSASATWLVSNPQPTSKVNPLTGTFSKTASNASPTDTLTIRDTLTGADKLAADQSGVTTAAAGANPTAVMLAKNIGRKDPAVARNDTAADSNNPGYIVAAPLVDLNATVPGVATPTPIGRYAYWVSDEGIKAKVNIKDPTLKTDSTGAVQVGAVTNDAGINTLAQNQLHFVAPQAVAAHKILPDTLSTNFRGAADYRQNPKIDQVLTPQQLPFLPSVAPTGYLSNRYLADVTTYSYGVLADVRNGGLRKDLTAAMEDLGGTISPTPKNYAKLNPDGRARVYRVAAQSTDLPVTTSADVSVDAVPNTNTVTTALDGLRWLDLYDYYNLYKKVSPSVSSNIIGARTKTTTSVTAPFGVGDPAGSRPYAIGTKGLAWSDTNTTNQFSHGVLAPICLGFRWDVAISTRHGTIDPSKYVLQVHYYPMLVLYNPYAVSVKSSNFRYSRATVTSGDNDTSIVVGGTTYTTVLNNSDINYRVILSTLVADSADLAPGEIRIYGLNANRHINTVPGSPSGTFTSVANDFEYNNSMGFASRFTSAPSDATLGTTQFDGLTSVNYNQNYYQYTDLLQIQMPRPSRPSTPRTPLTWTTIPELAGDNTSVAFSGAIINGVASNNPASGNSATFTPNPNNDAAVPANVFGPVKFSTGSSSNGQTFGALTGVTDSAGQRFMQSSAPGISDINGSSIPTAPPSSGLTLKSLLNNPVFYMGFYQRKKGLLATVATGYSNRSFRVPFLMGNSEGFNLFYDRYSAYAWDELYQSNLAANLYGTYPMVGNEMLISTSGAYKTTGWGDESLGLDPSLPNKPRNVLTDVPIQPMVSLGQFMHIKPFYFRSLSSYANMPFGTMFVGGSYPNPSVALDTTVFNAAASGVSTLYCDHSYLANQALFDTYFLSTVPPATLPATASLGTANPVSWTAFNAANPDPSSTVKDTTVPFLNSRVVPYRKNGVAPALANLRDMDKAAANLLLNGAFNVNSTSIDAWRSLLSSLSGNDLSIYDATAQATVTLTAAQLLNPLSRFWSASSNTNLNTPWCGVRALTDPQVTELATRIVAEVKTRGPFLSMADFLNRRLGSSASDSTDLTRAGTLQAAIDKTSPDINASAKTSTGGVAYPAVNVPTTQKLPMSLPLTSNMNDASSTTGAPWKTSVGAPGYLMQQDLVQAFSPVLAARSDTFVIRTYGETVNPVTQKVESKAYGEAVVQRLPDYIDQTAVAGSDELAPASAGTTNQKFGRRFKIISFRWLSPNDL